MVWCTVRSAMMHAKHEFAAVPLLLHVVKTWKNSIEVKWVHTCGCGNVQSD